MTAPPPTPATGDPDADAELVQLREASQEIAEAQARVLIRSRDRQRLVLRLRERGVLFRVIADAVPTTEQTIYKIHRDAREALREEQRQEAHSQGDHSLCAPENCPIVAAEEQP